MMHFRSVEEMQEFLDKGLVRAMQQAQEAKNEPTPDTSTSDQPMAEHTVYQDNWALSRVMSGRAGVTFFDPQCEMPVREEDEQEMDEAGPHYYIHALSQKLGLTIDPIPPSEHECRRLARKILRSLKSYPAERYIQ